MSKVPPKVGGRKASDQQQRLVRRVLGERLAANEELRRWVEQNREALQEFPPANQVGGLDAPEKRRRDKQQADREREPFRAPRDRERFAGFERNEHGWLVSTAPKRLSLGIPNDAPTAAQQDMAERLVRLANAVLEGGAGGERVARAYAAAFAPPAEEWSWFLVAAASMLQKAPPSVRKAGVACDPLDLCEILLGARPILPDYPRLPWYVDAPGIVNWLIQHMTPAAKGGRGRFTKDGMRELLLSPEAFADAVLSTKAGGQLEHNAVEIRRRAAVARERPNKGR